MAYNEASNRAAQKYKKDNIKRVPLDMQITEYERLKAVADSQGEKVNEYIKKAIRERMEREQTTAAGVDFHIEPERTEDISK